MSAIASQASAEAAYELAVQAKNEAGEMKAGAEQARDDAQTAAA